MKFGKRLLAIAAKNEAFAPYFLDYKCLKKLVKRVGDHGRRLCVLACRRQKHKRAWTVSPPIVKIMLHRSDM